MIHAFYGFDGILDAAKSATAESSRLYVMPWVDCGLLADGVNLPGLFEPWTSI
jgi:hypothetical protein